MPKTVVILDSNEQVRALVLLLSAAADAGTPDWCETAEERDGAVANARAYQSIAQQIGARHLARQFQAIAERLDGVPISEPDSSSWDDRYELHGRVA